MKIHHLRNTTMVIETDDKVILVNPMLGKTRNRRTNYHIFRFKPQRNAIIDLPHNAIEIIENVTHCLTTNLHSYHLDKSAERFLEHTKTLVICRVRDGSTLNKED